jgi:flagellar biosynthesis protein FliP
MSNGEIGLEEFYGEVEQPMREFMYRSDAGLQPR